VSAVADCDADAEDVAVLVDVGVAAADEPVVADELVDGALVVGGSVVVVDVVAALVGDGVTVDGVGPDGSEEFVGVGVGVGVGVDVTTFSSSHFETVVGVAAAARAAATGLEVAARLPGARARLTAIPAVVVSKTPPATRPVETGRTRAKHMKDPARACSFFSSTC